MTKAEEILNISHALSLSHIGSNLCMLPVLEEIYTLKKPHDIVILDNAHAHLAHLCFMHASPTLIKQQIQKYGIHCDREAGCDASGGSLGHGIGIGIGYAIADRSRDVYVVVSDGSMMEGSNWEALRIKSDLRLDNLIIYANLNGYSALAEVNGSLLAKRMTTFRPPIRIRFTNNTKDFDSIDGHYKKL